MIDTHIYCLLFYIVFMGTNNCFAFAFDFDSASASASDGLFYIYEWPDVPISMYPKPDAVLYPNTTYSHGFHSNHGIGDAINLDIGLYNTWQFSLFRNLFNRLYVHPKRTR